MMAPKAFILAIIEKLPENFLQEIADYIAFKINRDERLEDDGILQLMLAADREERVSYDEVMEVLRAK